MSKNEVKQMQEEFLLYGSKMRALRKCCTGEDLDTTPVEIPFDCKKPESLNDMIMRIVKAGRITDLEANDLETLEEADDFDCDDDDFPDPSSPHEEFFDPDGNSLGFAEQNERDRQRVEAHARISRDEVATDENSPVKRGRPKKSNSIEEAIESAEAGDE